MTLQWSVRLVIMVVLLTAMPALRVDALPINIEFIEGSGNVFVTVQDIGVTPARPLPPCGAPPCIVSMGATHTSANVAVAMPAGTPNFGPARAVLVETDAEPKPGSTSDIVRLRIQQEALQPRLRASFTSDTETGDLPAAPRGFGSGEFEATLHCLGGCPDGTERFFQGTPDRFVRLPDGVVRISVQSDVVPEPSTLLLFGSSLAGLSGLAWRRHRRK
jgi:hypothetical protein